MYNSTDLDNVKIQRKTKTTLTQSPLIRLGNKFDLFYTTRAHRGIMLSHEHSTTASYYVFADQATFQDHSVTQKHQFTSTQCATLSFSMCFIAT